MRLSRLFMCAIACGLALLVLPASALAYTLYGASGETTMNAYGLYYAGQQNCTGQRCHTDIVDTPSVHGDFVTVIPNDPGALSPSATSKLWPTPMAGIQLSSSDIYLQLGDPLGFHDYVGANESTKATVNPSDDLKMWSGLSYTIGSSAWDPSTSVTGSAYSQSCSGCHNLGVTRPSNATYTLANGGQETTSTPSGAVGFGIQCEVCHGTGKNPGAHQPGIPGVVGGTQILNAQVCGQCHVTGTTSQNNVSGKAFSSPNGYTPDATLTAFITPTLAIPTDAQFMSYITSGGAKPAFLPNGDDYSLRHDYYNEWLNNLVPSSHGGAYGHANPTNSTVAGRGDSKCLGCHSGLGFLARIGATSPLGSLLVTDAPTLAQVKSSDPGISCQICHDGHVGYNADQTGYDSARKWDTGKPVECGDCHNWQFEVMGQAVQTEIIAGHRYARPALNTSVSHPQRELFTGGEGGANGNGGLWGVAPMGEFMSGQTCQDCHMPRTAREGMPANDDSSTEATRMSHRFHVTLPGDAARWNLRTGGDSCAVPGCHTGSAADYTRADFQQWIDTIQSGTVRQINETTASLAAVSTKLGMKGVYSDFIAAEPATVTAPSPAEWEMLQKAAQNVGFVNADSSEGIHQPQYAAAGLSVAEMWARSYNASITASAQPRIDGGEGTQISCTLLGNDGQPLVGATVLLEASTDGGATWTTALSKKMTKASYTFLTGPVMGETLFRCSYQPDAGVVYRSATMDVQVPVTTLTLSPSTAATAWVDSNVGCTLSTPATGAITFYSIAGATVQPLTVYAGPFVIITNGESDVTYWSSSAQGDELQHVQPVRIDQSVPAVTADVSALYLDDAVVHFTASDDFSGPKSMDYSVDGGAWVHTNGTSVTLDVTTLGAHNVRAHATNNLGHTGPDGVWTFSVKRATALWVTPAASTVKSTRGRSWTYSAVLRTRDGDPIARKSVVVQRSSNGSSWATVATLRTSASGAVSRKYKPSAKGTSYWRWYVPGDGSYLPAVGRRTKLVVK